MERKCAKGKFVYVAEYHPELDEESRKIYYKDIDQWGTVRGNLRKSLTSLFLLHQVTAS